MAADAHTRTPQSRRERPAKPALSRDGIIDAALTLLQDEGLSTVTMRRIAAALDTGPASLYVYVRDTEDLHAQMLDVLIGRMPASLSDGTWRARLHALLASYGEILHAYPEIARMTLTTQPVGPHYFALVESILELLAEGGIPDDAAAWGVDMLLATVTAGAIEHGPAAATGDGAKSLAATAAAIAIAPGERYPRIVRLGDELLAGTGAERFHWGLEVLLNGLRATPRPATSDRERA